MNFSSDTSAPAHPNVLAAIARVNSGMEPSYGADSVTARVRLLLKDVFETDDFDVWMTASGILIFDHVPDGLTLFGIAMIILSGAYVAYREHAVSKAVTHHQPVPS